MHRYIVLNYIINYESILGKIKILEKSLKPIKNGYLKVNFIFKQS